VGRWANTARTARLAASAAAAAAIGNSLGAADAAVAAFDFALDQICAAKETICQEASEHAGYYDSYLAYEREKALDPVRTAADAAAVELSFLDCGIFEVDDDPDDDTLLPDEDLEFAVVAFRAAADAATYRADDAALLSKLRSGAALLDRMICLEHSQP
jgi:hypothetical protein